MYFSKPIILGLEGEAEEIIKSSKSGVIMKSGDEQSLIDCINQLYNNPNLLNFLGDNGNEYVKINYNRYHLASDMINMIKSKLKKY